LVRGLLAHCGVTALEMLFSARSPEDHLLLSEEIQIGYEWLPTEDVDLRRAVEVQSVLARRGRLREVPIADLVIAAIAERHRVAVLHYDADYDVIAQITGQPTRWVVPQGSID
jgi:predicted nucleic acid-binding protein